MPIRAAVGSLPDARVPRLPEGDQPMTERLFELKLAGHQRPERWPGSSGEEAARRYVDAHRDAVVIAYREAHRYGVSVLGDARQVIG